MRDQIKKKPIERNPLKSPQVPSSLPVPRSSTGAKSVFTNCLGSICMRTWKPGPGIHTDVISSGFE